MGWAFMTVTVEKEESMGPTVPKAITLIMMIESDFLKGVELRFVA